ncbi:MAG: iron ABC transporter permease [Spirochaetia bacterium]|nr:iron ABC transporter permease [Spirochaetia bacterium]
MISFIHKNYFLTISIFFLFGFLFLLLSLTLGPGEITLNQVLGVLAGYDSANNSLVHSLVWEIRLPRALLAMLIGASLGCAGTITQGIFQNPLASPNVLGLSYGAAVFVVLGIILGIDEMALYITPFLAALGAIFTFVLLYLFTLRSAGIFSLLLSGIAVSTIFSAVITLLLSLQIKDYEVTIKVMQWLMGNLEMKSWIHLKWIIIPVSLGITGAFFLRRNLDVLHLGEETAASLGISFRYTYFLGVFFSALLIGASTAVSGIIGFVGLVVPHLARLLIGAKHTKLIPFSIVLGAFFLLAVDVISRVTLKFYLPPGAVTSLIGAPVFLWLVQKNYRNHKV